MPTREHKSIEHLVRKQREWRDQCWNLIASENTPSPAVARCCLLISRTGIEITRVAILVPGNILEIATSSSEKTLKEELGQL